MKYRFQQIVSQILALLLFGSILISSKYYSIFNFVPIFFIKSFPFIISWSNFMKKLIQNIFLYIICGKMTCFLEICFTCFLIRRMKKCKTFLGPVRLRLPFGFLSPLRLPIGRTGKTHWKNRENTLEEIYVLLFSTEPIFIL